MSSSQDGTTDTDYQVYLNDVEKDSSTPPPPSSDSNSSTPSDSSNSSPPPPSSESPPPPDSSSSSSPSPPPPSDNNNNDNSSNSSPPPPPPSDSDSSSSSSSSSDKSPPPPPESSSDNSNSSPPPPPPPSSGSSSSWQAPPPPPAISGSSTHSSVTLSSKTALIAGASVGGGLLLLLVIVCLMACCRKKKRNKEHGKMDFFMDNPHSNEIGGNGYYNSSGNWPANKDHAVKVPPPPSQYSSGAWSGAAPPPPPPGLNSSEIGSFGGGASLPPPHPSLALGFNQSTFSYDDLAAATSGFTKENLLGQGGFGYVHKGVLPNGKEIAVKSLKSGSGQGEREFQAEVDIISRVHHKHLVSLVGYCIADAQRMLVYEFVPNSSLEHHLYGKDQPVMDFPTRLKIALGSAKGFAYLHEDCHPRIIHRDIKAANILLDNNYEAKVADFGLAKLSNDNHTHVSTRIMGTFGYLAPEYASSGKLTEKSDVYSFGVVLLELITGKRPVDLSGDDDSLVDWARPILVQVTEGGSYEELVDPRLGDNYNHQEMLCMVACAAACIRHSARRRPRMSQVVRALEGDANLEDLNDGVRPGHSAMFGSSGSSDYDSYGTGIRRVKPRGNTIMSSNEFTSSEHTGEYNIHASPSSSADSHESHRRMP